MLYFITPKSYFTRAIKIGIVSVIVAGTFLACSPGFDKQYYQRITGVKFPGKYEVLETFDNGEWLTGTILEVDSVELREFVGANHFDTFTDRDKPYLNLLKNPYFKLKPPAYTDSGRLFILAKSKDKNSWTYLVDMETKRVWSIIVYPDWSGN